MPGFSITLLLLPSANDVHNPSSTRILDLLDEETNAPGWKWSSKSPPSAQEAVPPPTSATAVERSSSMVSFPDSKRFTDAIERACKNLIAAEPEITHMDSIAGDGDCGLTLKAGASGT